jgi:hypothetical protein
MTKVIDLRERVMTIGYIQNAFDGYPPDHYKRGELFTCKDCFDQSPEVLGDGPLEWRPITLYDLKNWAKINLAIWGGGWSGANIGACPGCRETIFREEEEDGIDK